METIPKDHLLTHLSSTLGTRSEIHVSVDILSVRDKLSCPGVPDFGHGRVALGIEPSLTSKNISTIAIHDIDNSIIYNGVIWILRNSVQWTTFILPILMNRHISQYFASQNL